MLCILVTPLIFFAVTGLCLLPSADTVSFSLVCRIGAVLKLIGGDAFIDKVALRQFLLSCQSKVPLPLISYLIVLVATNK